MPTSANHQPLVVDLNERLNEAFAPLLAETRRFLVLCGGAGSGKSWFAAQKILLRCMLEARHRFVVTRKVARTLRKSVFARLWGQISEWGISHLWERQKTDLSLVYKPNGSEIWCVGIDDPEKLKSIDGPTGFWHEEPTELDPTDFEQCNLRLRGETAYYKQHILSFNPVSDQNWIKARFFDVASNDTRIMRSTYRDNRYIDDEYKRVLENLRNVDEQLYKIYAEGEWGELTGLVYTGWDVVPHPEYFDDVFYGLDFGFKNPTALVCVKMVDGEPYVKERVYETEWTNDRLIAVLRSSCITNEPIYADAEDPARIEEIANAGFNIHAVKKGAGSVHSGIVFCKRYPLHVDPASHGLLSELKTYKWAQDRRGNQLDAPVKFRDHALDAYRYAMVSHLADAPDYVFG